MSQLDFRLSPALSNATLNGFFSVGWPSWQKSSDTSDWQPVLQRSLVYIGAFDRDRLVGFVNVAWDGRDHAFILDTRVDPDYRHLRLGGELVARAARAAKDAGCEVLHVDCAPELQPFNEACGFRPTAAGLIDLNTL
ncbi:MAG: GNAT family N-acetyltransferase [Deltaproteobacteria bacterium]|nr:GNAT family N-acetyltransferase [Deltaproteobacteria bacterium]